MPSSISANDLVYSPVNDIYSLGHNGELQEQLDNGIKISFEDDTNIAELTVRKGRNKNITIAIKGRTLGDELRSLEDPFCIIVPGLAGIPAQENYKTPSVIKRLAARGDANSVFRNILFQLSKDQDDWEAFTGLFKRIYPEVVIEVAFDENSDEHIKATITESGKRLPIDASGTGVLQAIQILAYICLFKPKLLILDEPDSHLHPNNQRKLIEVLNVAQQENGAQILISTHSKYVVDELTDSATIFWINSGKLIEKIDSDEQAYVLRSLMEIGALSEGESLGGQQSKVTVITEDQDAQYIKLLLNSNQWTLEEVEIWPYQGCSNVQVANALIKYIRSKNQERIIVIHRDRDFLTELELDEYKQKIAGENIHFFIPDGNDLESYFWSRPHFAALYNEFSAEQYDEIIGAAIDIKRDKLQEKLINTRIDALRKRGEKVNEGAIAVEYTRFFQENPERYSHGKLLLKSMNEELRRRTQVNSKLITASPALQIQALQDIKNMVWQP